MQVRSLGARVAATGEHLAALDAVTGASSQRASLQVHVLAECAVVVLNDHAVGVAARAPHGVVWKVIDRAHDDAIGAREHLGAEAEPVTQALAAARMGAAIVIHFNQVERVRGATTVALRTVITLTDDPCSIDR